MSNFEVGDGDSQTFTFLVLISKIITNICWLLIGKGHPERGVCKNHIMSSRVTGRWLLKHAIWWYYQIIHAQSLLSSPKEHWSPIIHSTQSLGFSVAPPLFTWRDLLWKYLIELFIWGSSPRKEFSMCWRSRIVMVGYKWPMSQLTERRMALTEASWNSSSSKEFVCSPLVNRAVSRYRLDHPCRYHVVRAAVTLTPVC